MLKERVNRCVLLRVCVLLFVLCICAHVYVEFKGHDLKSWKRVAQVSPKNHQQDSKHQVFKDTSRTKPTCCPPVRQPRKNMVRMEGGDMSLLQSPREVDVLLGSHGYQVGVEGPELFKAYRRSTQRAAVHMKLGGEDKWLERALAQAGCEVHCFDPSIKEAHLQDSHMWLHRLSVDWRDPNPAIPAQRQHGTTKKLATILNDFGHRQVDVLKLDMESAEWKILENMILEGVLPSVGLLLLEIHVHWAGFEVGGDEPSVVRYWFSLLRELEHAHFHLYHSYSDPAKPHLFLHKNLHNASSTYILGWVNTNYSPQ
ncbi:hypothetical protein NFI96_000930 [Prochilodus magdalenae]|nr:hypothetical protein NFI96_000930 [Prochilodus magdalenae]